MGAGRSDGEKAEQRNKMSNKPQRRAIFLHPTTHSKQIYKIEE
jgi:hypothetical protein